MREHQLFKVLTWIEIDIQLREMPMNLKGTLNHWSMEDWYLQKPVSNL